MKIIKISAKEAREINLRNGMETWDNDGHPTFWATDEERTGTWAFDTRKERDNFVNKAR